VLELGGVPLTELPLRNRRKRLEDFLPGLHPSLQLMTPDARPRIGAAVARAVARIGGRGGKEIGWSLRAGAARLGEGKAPADRGLRGHRLSR
jgi:hypothetical protein